MKNKSIDNGKSFDWGRASKDYAKYRDIYPATFYEKIIEIGLCTKGQHVLDLGTGTGVLPRNLYSYGAKFVGADISANQIEEAKRLSKANNLDIEYIVESAEDVDFPNESFDTVLACQCYIYFDMQIVVPKMHKLLKKNGRFCILWVAWLPDEDEIVCESEKLILKYNPSWNGAGFKRIETMALNNIDPYFKENNVILYDLEIPFSRESWHGRIKACRGIGASSLPEKELEKFDVEHKALLRQYPKEFTIRHQVLIYDLIKTNMFE